MRAAPILARLPTPSSPTIAVSGKRSAAIPCRSSATSMLCSKWMPFVILTVTYLSLCRAELYSYCKKDGTLVTPSAFQPALALVAAKAAMSPTELSKAKSRKLEPQPAISLFNESSAAWIGNAPSQVLLKEHASVRLAHDTTASAYDQSGCVGLGQTSVAIYNQSAFTAYGPAKVACHGLSIAHLYGTSTAQAYNSSTVFCRNQATVHLFDQSVGYLYEQCTAVVYSCDSSYHLLGSNVIVHFIIPSAFCSSRYARTVNLIAILSVTTILIYFTFKRPLIEYLRTLALRRHGAAREYWND